MSKILIAYASKYGCTEECAICLADQLNDEAELLNLKERKPIDLNAYDKIIIGGSIYAGRIQKEVRTFCTQNEDVLKNKKLGLFICGTGEGEMAVKELDSAFPQELVHAAVARECFGGKIILNKLGFLERKIVKAVAKVEADMINLSDERIAHFAQTVNEA